MGRTAATSLAGEPTARLFGASQVQRSCLLRNPLTNETVELPSRHAERHDVLYSLCHGELKVNMIQSNNGIIDLPYSNVCSPVVLYSHHRLGNQHIPHKIAQRRRNNTDGSLRCIYSPCPTDLIVSINSRPQLQPRNPSCPFPVFLVST
jgi:hypothetical protein